MIPQELEVTLHTLTNTLVNELILLTPESMSEIQFEIAATDDGSANIGLLGNRADAAKVALCDATYAAASQYLPLVKQYLSGWQQSLIVIRETDEGWKVSVNFQRN